MNQSGRIQLNLKIDGPMTTAANPFYFYAYYRNPKVTLHKAECGFCKNGKGMQHNKLGNVTGRWRGGYASFEQALEAANGISHDLGVEPEYCKRCFPDKAESQESVNALLESIN